MQLKLNFRLLLGLVVTLALLQSGRGDIGLDYDGTFKMAKMWDFFGDTNVKYYEYEGPVFRLQFRHGCKVIMPSAKWELDEVGTWFSTIIFVHFREAKHYGCMSFTQLIKQLPPVMSALVELGYPPVKLALFGSRVDEIKSFGPPEVELPDNYFWHRPPGLNLALIGRDTAIWINHRFLSGGNSTILGRATQDPGPWNRMIHQPAWEFLRAFTYITHGIAASYACYQLVITLYRCRGRPNVTAAIFLLAMYYLIVNAVCQYGDLQSNGGYTAIFISWSTNSMAFSLMVFLWVKTMHYLEISRFFNFVYVISALNAVNWSILSILMSAAIMTSDRHHYRNATKLLLYVQPVIIILQGGYIFYYGFRFLRLLKNKPPKDPTVRRIQWFTYISYFAFVGYMFLSLASILMCQYREDDINTYIARNVCYKVASLLCYGGIFWMLRAHQAVGNIKVFATNILTDLYSGLGRGVRGRGGGLGGGRRGGGGRGPPRAYKHHHLDYTHRNSLGLETMAGFPGSSPTGMTSDSGATATAVDGSYLNASRTFPGPSGISGMGGGGGGGYHVGFGDSPGFILNPSAGPIPPTTIIGGLSTIPAHKTTSPSNFRMQIP
ncbi:hypothetical protein H4R33_000785 [Dimargaris cristalligena]|uniref:Intimal thickness related receptor IRP domain-containing protein n=1 Tax=Dimargaris cristalligena TaxID=215637 RepID=A0A4P9ZSI1_9FUNG|nr:hypothetical protein H4R33_000785 [Dimargaris cristalligena]RKP35430.1 hypothetical protein BJ085DRAFT_37310 [Dimargaris cristalligena]|eukprot:RKP35430.1 hypothetical protein BJ085DRAFT_37310 [Dimargaris cristalligena]